MKTMGRKSSKSLTFAQVIRILIKVAVWYSVMIMRVHLVKSETLGLVHSPHRLTLIHHRLSRTDRSETCLNRNPPTVSLLVNRALTSRGSSHPKLGVATLKAVDFQAQIPSRTCHLYKVKARSS